MCDGNAVISFDSLVLYTITTSTMSSSNQPIVLSESLNVENDLVLFLTNIVFVWVIPSAYDDEQLIFILSSEMNTHLRHRSFLSSLSISFDKCIVLDTQSIFFITC